MIFIKLTLIDTSTSEMKSQTVEDAFTVEKGYSQKKLFALYQRARAKLKITKYSEEEE